MASSLLDRIRGGGAKKRTATRKPATRKPARKAAVRHAAPKRTVKRRTTRTTRTAKKVNPHRANYMKLYMRAYRANLKSKGYTLDKDGHKKKMTAAQRERWAKRKNHHAKNFNHKQSSSMKAAEKRGERKSKLVRARKNRHGRKLSTAVSARVKGTAKGRVAGARKRR